MQTWILTSDADSDLLSYSDNKENDDEIVLDERRDESETMMKQIVSNSGSFQDDFLDFLAN